MAFRLSPVVYLDFKTGPIQRELRRYIKMNPRFGSGPANIMGMPAGESVTRTRKIRGQRNARMSIVE